MKRLGKSIMVALGLVLALVPAVWAGSYSFVDIDYPGGITTLNDVRGLNNQGQIVGSYTLGGRQYSFIYSGGTYSTLGIPGTSNVAWGINDNGQVAGTYDNHGYIYNTADSSFTSINVPGSYTTQIYGINDAGQVSGFYHTSITNAFIYDTNTGSWTYVSKAGATQTLAYSINEAGIIAGNYTLGGHDYGYTYDGSFHDLNVTGADNTRAVGINDQGDIAGRYWDDGGTIYGFVYHDGNFETLDMPGAEIARVLGINNAGQIVGLYTTDGGTTYHGYLGTPVPAPGTLLLLVSGLAGLAACRRKLS